MDKCSCGDCLTFYSVLLRDDVLIENNKYGYITMQNNGAMKIVNFMHAQVAETRRSFHPSVNAGYEASGTFDNARASCLQIHVQHAYIVQLIEMLCYPHELGHECVVYMFL